MKTLYLDIETNIAHDTIWCVSYLMGDDCGTTTDTTFLQSMINTADKVCGHNIIGFDAPVLFNVWDVSIPPEKLLDTLVMSRLFDPSKTGGHSLQAWGEFLGYPKIEFTDYDEPAEGESYERWQCRMAGYCEQDVIVLSKLHKHLKKEMERMKFSPSSVEIEHKVAIITKQQEVNGFKLDIEKATDLYQTVTARMTEIEETLQEIFPPIVEERWSEKTGKRLKDKVTEFNVGSRMQIAERLQSIGVKLTKRTEKTEKGGGGNLIVDEDILAEIDAEEAQLIAEYLMLQKRSSQVDSWFKHVKDDGRVHGRVMTNGAVTGRMTHSNPNMAQIPATGKPYGKECRECWTVEEGNKLVGADASGLELRMLAHYMQDEDYTKQILEGDIHTANQNAAGLSERNQAKTFIYAFLYGAGAGKIGEIVGGGYKEGAKLIEQFLKNTPALAALKAKVARIAKCGSLPGLDGRRLRVRSEHAALNTLLQGAGAIVMKQALIRLVEHLDDTSIPYKIVCNVHDEWQIETPEEFADTVGKMAVDAIKQAGVDLELRCPLDGEYNVGDSWAETH